MTNNIDTLINEIINSDKTSLVKFNNLMILFKENTDEPHIIKKILTVLPSRIQQNNFLISVNNLEAVLGINLFKEQDLYDYIDLFSYDDILDSQSVVYKYFKYNQKTNVVPTRFDHKTFIPIFKRIMAEDKEGIEKTIKLFDLLTKNRILWGVSKCYIIFEILYDYKVDIKYIIQLLETKYLQNNSFSETKLLENLEPKYRYQAVRELLDYKLRIDDFVRKETYVRFASTLNREEFEKIFVDYILENEYMQVLLTVVPGDGTYNIADYIELYMKYSDSKDIGENLKYIKEVLSTKDYEIENRDTALLYEKTSEYLNIDRENLQRFTSRFGFMTFAFLDNPSVLSILKLDRETFDKFLNLFSDKYTKYDKTYIKSILHALLQRKFLHEFPEVSKIFSKWKEAYESKNYVEANKIQNEINKVVNINMILREYGLVDTEFFSKLATDKSDSKCNDILHTITNKYIGKKREQYVEQNIDTVENGLNFNKKPTRQDFKNLVYKNVNIDIRRLLNKYKKFLDKDQLYFLSNDELYDKIVAFKQGKKVSLLPSEERYLGIYSGILDILYNSNILNYMFRNISTDKYENVQPEISKTNELFMISELKGDDFINLLKDSSEYGRLEKFLSKHKILGWGETFNPILKDCDIEYDGVILASLLSNFTNIMDRTRKDASITEILDYANSYEAYSDDIVNIFGRENYTLITTNPAPQKSSKTKDERISECLDLVHKMFKREYVTIPPINEELTLNNSQKIKVVVGNVTDMINLTYGERTESCMRAGGLYDSMFKFCIENDDGFHIRFVNPNTGKLVTRVSGIRNGNTVFLNQLRDSLDSEYSDEDLYKAISETAKLLIQKSIDSELKIDNVIITPDYALASVDVPINIMTLDGLKKQKALRDVPFNYEDDIILFNASGIKKITYEFSDDEPKYEVERMEVIKYTGKDALYQMEHIHALDRFLGNSVKKEDKEINNTDNLIIYSGEDFYIDVTNINNPNIFIISVRKDNVRTHNEIEDTLTKIGVYDKEKSL